MPLIAHLKQGFEDPNQPPAWHRNEERRARGLFPVHNPATQLESWERELVWTEILLLTGNPDSSFRHLARAWGRDKGFRGNGKCAASMPRAWICACVCPTGSKVWTRRFANVCNPDWRAGTCRFHSGSSLMAAKVSFGSTGRSWPP